MSHLSQDPFDIAREAIDTGDLQVLQELRYLLSHERVDVNGWCDEVTLLGMVAEAGDLALVQLMLEYGADVNLETDTNVATALMQAASGGNLDIVKLLVNTGSNVDDVRGGEFALLCAVQARHKEIVDYLTPLTNLKLRRKAQLATAETFEIQTQEEVSSSVLELFGAITSKDTQKAQQVVIAGVDVNSIHEDKTAISYAAEKMKFDIVAILLEAGADPNLTGRRGIPALIAAAGYGREMEIIQALIETGSDVNVAIDGRTALMQAVEYARLGSSQKIVQILIEAGADLEAQDKYGNTALMFAAAEDKMDIVQILCDAGASDSTLNAVSLLKAARNGDVERIHSLISEGTNPNAKNSEGYSSLALASSRGHIEIINLLSEAGAEIDSRQHQGWTPLMLAINSGRVSSVETLIHAGADVNAKDNLNRSVINHAQEASLQKQTRREILKLLKKNGATD